MKTSRIESKESFEKLFAASHKQRYLFVDSATPSENWNAIGEEQRILVLHCQRPGVSLAQILIPHQRMEKPLSVIMERNLNHLITQFNALGWLTCCRWLCEVFKNLLVTFAPDDSAEYTLQALLEDFQHSVFSIVLQQETNELIATLAKQEQSGPNPLELEKELVRKREALLEHLTDQKNLLDKMIVCLNSITPDHPQLVGLKGQITSFLVAYGEPISADPAKNPNNLTLLAAFANQLNAAFYET